MPDAMQRTAFGNSKVCQCSNRWPVPLPLDRPGIDTPILSEIGATVKSHGSRLVPWVTKWMKMKKGDHGNMERPWQTSGSAVTMPVQWARLVVIDLRKGTVQPGGAASCMCKMDQKDCLFSHVRNLLYQFKKERRTVTEALSIRHLS